MRLSTHLHVTKLAEGWRGVYSPFGHRIAFLFDEAWESLEQQKFNEVDSKIIAYLVENNILVENEFEKEWLEQHLPNPQVRLNSMYLVVTQNCNFGCKYCAVVENFDNPSRIQEKMDIETGRKAIVFFTNQLIQDQPKDARVTFYGGEPTLNQELIFDLVPRIRAISYPNQTKPVEVVMISNGYIYNPELTDLFKTHSVGVCISLDGTKKHQDVTRTTRVGHKSTFDRVVANFHRYKNAGLSMGISTALGNHNAFDLKEICDFYAELGAPFVEFQIPYQVAQESNQLWVSSTNIASHLMEAYADLRKHGITEGTTHRRLRDFSLGQVHVRDCGSSGSQLVVAPDGSIGPCHSLVGTRTFFEKNVRDATIDPKLMNNFTEWAQCFPLNKEDCKMCPYISICGGGCNYNSYIAHGTIWGKDPQVCSYMEVMVDWILKDLWQESGMAAKYSALEHQAS